MIRDKTIQVKVSAEEKEQVERMAGDVPVSTYCRRKILAHPSGLVTPRKPAPPSERDDFTVVADE